MTQLEKIGISLKTPRDFGLNHSEWRPGQYEMVSWAMNRVSADSSGISLVQAATGTGKTTLPRALSSVHKTVALVRTRSLQSANYDQGYGFQPVYGRSNYDCVHADAENWAKADDCIFSEQGMAKCPHGQIVLHPENELELIGMLGERPGPCPYVLEREDAKKAQRAVLNYAYWFHTYEKWPTPTALVCDEGHQLSDAVLEWAGCTISDEARQKWGFAPFPMIRGGSSGMLTKTAPATERAMTWLGQCVVALRAVYTQLSQKAKDDEKARKELRKAELLGKKLVATFDALNSIPEDWYIKSGPGVHNGKPAFVARPLTARHHFKRYFKSQPWHLFVMSATIGDPSVFAAELGIDGYEYHYVPSLYPADSRPVLALDVPTMGRSANDKAQQQQADQIAKAVKDCPKDWSGIIHVNRISEAPLLAERLAHRGLQDRVWVAPTGIGTDGAVKAWQERQRKVPGSLNIAWNLWEGYDGRTEKISIVAKIPYPYLGDEYEQARQAYDRKLYLQRAAWQAEQGLGRSRRGRPEDYDTDGERRGLVCLADGSWRRVKSYFSEALRESIVTN